MIDRAFTLLGSFDQAHRRLSLSELSRRSGLPLSTTSRLASRMVAWGALERDETGGFAIGLRLWELASLAEPALGLREVAAPFLDDLNIATRQHSQLAILDGHDIVVVDRRVGRYDLPLTDRAGSRHPPVATGAGLVLLAHASSELVEEILGSHFGWPLHECPRPSAHAVRAQLAEIRKSGLAIVDRPTSPLTSVAAPIQNRRGTVVAALSVVVPTEAADPARLEPALRTTARSITRVLSEPGSPRRRLPAWGY
ncbi:MAG: IclR family transcriptional regulator [Cellulomonadaceae bacterium]|nr:IclR family transcriptional regulator [Cellulomonadaceae bacterium]